MGTVAKLKHQQPASLTLETHETIAAYEAALHRHRMRRHDLAAEMIARGAKLEEQTIEELKEIAGE